MSDNKQQHTVEGRVISNKMAKTVTVLVERQVKHLTQLVADLLDLSRITSNKLEIQRQPLDLADVIHAAVESTRPILERCEQQLVIAMPARKL